MTTLIALMLAVLLVLVLAVFGQLVKVERAILLAANASALRKPSTNVIVLGSVTTERELVRTVAEHLARDMQPATKH